MDEGKIAAVRDWPTPACVRDVRSFHGLVNYYRKFIRDFSRLSAPLTDLTKKVVKFIWSEGQEAAFQALKAAIQTAPVLWLHLISPSLLLSAWTPQPLQLVEFYFNMTPSTSFILWHTSATSWRLRNATTPLENSRCWLWSMRCAAGAASWRELNLLYGRTTAI